MFDRVTVTGGGGTAETVELFELDTVTVEALAVTVIVAGGL